ncbi:glycoside hydrolase family 15 protein [Herbiconiux sp. L3-i23]|uniref:glycoside hydrolase family 15 protein n=1 Tax=Herbiconiux sp. L3-i23 TaxID=2905871 RepID=UPI00206AF108|nr:glycoside hydrolase family 15 protein [Herbiconiux sp. L3-i23]BDI21721.1 glycoside hydrolase family 15 [Herbiconiux sp. L3-i23]
MPLAIEDYAMIGDRHTAALVGRDGSIDWLCLPRFDSPSTFGALLGDADHGRWLLRPADGTATATRRYKGDTLILETEWTTQNGVVRVTDFMPYGNRRADVVRRVHGVRGAVRMRQDLRIRFGYASALPWVRQVGGAAGPALLAAAGPDALILRGPELRATGHAHTGEFTVSEGETVDLVLTWFPSHREAPAPLDVDAAFASTTAEWHDWAHTLTHRGPHHGLVIRSLLMLRALTHEDTGGIVAAATTSLPEQAGGVRNWDYRYVWLRDASLTLLVLLSHKSTGEAAHWRDWLLRAIAGDPSDVQIMYGLAGERDLAERTVTTLPGFRGAAPVRVGNGAVEQFQADVIGEVMVALEVAREAGLAETRDSWSLQRALLEYTARHIDEKDNGIWEMRGDPQYFTHSRAMMWAAFDRGVRAVERHGFAGDASTWRSMRDRLASEIEEHGFDRTRNSYVQHYGSTEVDASLLQLAQVGYLDYDDPRMLGTVAAIEHDLLADGLVLRYRSSEVGDGLPAGENPFLACSFWLVEQYAKSGRTDDATALMDGLAALASDVGIFSEEYDFAAGTQMGNVPQALTHLTFVRAADAIHAARPSHAARSESAEHP